MKSDVVWLAQLGKETAKRYVLFIIGLFFSGLGVAVTKRGGLGVYPISSVANVVSLKFPVFFLGTWLFLWNCVLILGQILILHKQFKVIQLLQIPLSVLFGWFTDFGMWLLGFIPANFTQSACCWYLRGQPFSASALLWR